MQRSAVLTILVIAGAAIAGGCGSPPPEVDFCDVLTTPAKFAGQEISTEVVIHPGQHGWVVYAMNCSSRVMAASPDWSKSAEASAAEQKVDQVFDQPDPQGVAVHVIGRVQLHSAGACCCNGLHLLSAGDSRIVTLPPAVMEPRGDPSVPPPCD